MKRQKTMQEKAYGFIQQHPGCSAIDISEGLGVSQGSSSALCTHLLRRDWVRREEARRLASNRPVYAYWAKSAEAKKTVVSSEMDVTRNVFSSELNSSLDTLLDPIAQAIAKQLAAKVRDCFTEEFRQMAPTLIGEISAPSPVEERQAPELVDFSLVPMEIVKTETKEPLRKIGIVGLYPNQQREIEKEFGESFRLSFWTNCNDWKRLEAMAMYCEVVFVMIRHVSHAETLHLKNDKANTVPIHGDTAALRVALTECYLAEASA